MCCCEMLYVNGSMYNVVLVHQRLLLGIHLKVKKSASEWCSVELPISCFETKWNNSIKVRTEWHNDVRQKGVQEIGDKSTLALNLQYQTISWSFHGKILFMKKQIVHVIGNCCGFLICVWLPGLVMIKLMCEHKQSTHFGWQHHHLQNPKFTRGAWMKPHFSISYIVALVNNETVSHAFKT